MKQEQRELPERASRRTAGAGGRRPPELPPLRPHAPHGRGVRGARRGRGRRLGARAGGELEPDLVVLDVQLPDIDGFEVAARLLARDPGLAIVLVSSRDRSEYGPLIERSGARGFVAKDELSGAALEEAARVSDAYRGHAARRRSGRGTVRVGARGGAAARARARRRWPRPAPRSTRPRRAGTRRTRPATLR